MLDLDFCLQVKPLGSISKTEYCMSVNLFPAILLAGPPHCGKSVLSFMLTQRLRQRQVAHYLLRAVPDGEGDWFLEGEATLMRAIRTGHKTAYSARFVSHFCSIIENRWLPLLVDIGGKPQGEQFEIIRACTHAILLYRDEEERRSWRKILDDSQLLPLAELRSTQTEPEALLEVEPILQAVIGGLEREVDKRQQGKVFEALLERVGGICTYPAGELEAFHLSRAPLPALTERHLAQQFGLPDAETNPIWQPEHLKRLKSTDKLKPPYALYGRGPIWLAAMLLAHDPAAPAAIFDVRYGWISLPEKLESGDSPAICFDIQALESGFDWIKIHLPDNILEMDELKAPRLADGAVEHNGGVVLSGKLPRWVCATLTRTLALVYAWVGVDDPRNKRVVVVHSQSPQQEVGDVLDRPAVS
jgi:CRISPR-associated protein Csx3